MVESLETLSVPWHKGSVRLSVLWRGWEGNKGLVILTLLLYPKLWGSLRGSLSPWVCQNTIQLSVITHIAFVTQQLMVCEIPSYAFLQWCCPGGHFPFCAGFLLLKCSTSHITFLFHLVTFGQLAMWAVGNASPALQRISCLKDSWFSLHNLQGSL